MRTNSYWHTKKVFIILLAIIGVYDDSDIVRTTVIDRNGRSYTTDYRYDSKHNLIKTQDYRGLVIEYTYNIYVKELTRKTYHKDSPASYLFSEHSYQDGSFVKTESDPRYMLNGEKLKTTYQHDTSRNLLLKQTAVNGQEYNYSYDDTTDDLMSLSSTVESKANENRFFYTRGYLTRVAHNGFNFGFAFDQLGRSKTVTVGDASASTSLLTMNYEKDGVNDVTETVFATGEKNRVTTIRERSAARFMTLLEKSRKLLTTNAEYAIIIHMMPRAMSPKSLKPIQAEIPLPPIPSSLMPTRD